MQPASSKTVIVVAGPTAVGKTALAIDLARHFGTAIISADSRQCYKELSVGVARPSPSELESVPHYFIASHHIREEVTAAAFESYALQKAEELFQQTDTVILAGGTGLYIRAFCEGLDDVPEVPPEVRKNIISAYEEHGLAWLQQQLKEKDPLFFERGEMKNPRRMMRALEVVETTGESIFLYRKGLPVERDFNIIKVGLELPRAELYQRINARVDQMMKDGLLEEVTALKSFRDLNALQTVGYSEMFDYLDGEIPLTRAIELIKQHTRHYAKRQMTWFKKDPAFHWFSPGQTDAVITFIDAEIRRLRAY